MWVMADPGDVAAVAPVLELTLDSATAPTALRCVGRLDARTRPLLMEAVAQLLRSHPTTVSIEIGELQVVDAEASSALSQVQQMMRQAGISVHWHGLGFDHVQKVPSLRHSPLPGTRLGVQREVAMGPGGASLAPTSTTAA